MNVKLYILGIILVITSLITACAKQPTETVVKTVVFTQEGSYVSFRYTRLEPGMVFSLSHDGKTYRLDRDSINLGEKDGEIYGQITSPMRVERISGLILDYRNVSCFETFTFGVKSGQSIEVQCEFPTQ